MPPQQCPYCLLEHKSGTIEEPLLAVVVYVTCNIVISNIFPCTRHIVDGQLSTSNFWCMNLRRRSSQFHVLNENIKILRCRCGQVRPKMCTSPPPARIPHGSTGDDPPKPSTNVEERLACHWHVQNRHRHRLHMLLPALSPL